ncbi:unnamed protein product [Sphagnum compactum]
MTTAFVDLSNDKTLLPSATLLSMKTASANKRNVAKPPHLFKVVVGAKSGSVAGSFQSLEAHKIAPSPVLLPERRRSGVLVSQSQTPKHIPALASSCRRSYPSHGAAVRRISEKEFDEVVLESKVPVLVDFWASWCGPCKLVAPSMDKIDQKYSGQVKVVKVETTENSELVEKYKVYGLPTLILFIDGKEVPGSRHEGAISFAKVESLLMSFLPTLVPS